MKKLYKLIKKNPKEFIELLRSQFNKGYLSNSHWEDFDGTKHLMYAKKSKDGSIPCNQIWFTFEDDLEGSTEMVLANHLPKADGVIKFMGYVVCYELKYDWND